VLPVEEATISSLATPAKSIDFAEGRINMRSMGLWAIGIGVLVSTAPIAVKQGYAGENEAKCTLATLNGQYLFAASATLFYPAFGIPKGTPPSPAASAGYHIFNGDGTGTDFVTFTVNGINQNVSSPVATTYTLNPDCTGTYSVQNGPTLDIFAAVDGSALSAIDTTPGVSASEGPDPRVGSSGRAE
jgi:hypothetical protein